MMGPVVAITGGELIELLIGVAPLATLPLVLGKGYRVPLAA